MQEGSAFGWHSLALIGMLRNSSWCCAGWIASVDKTIACPLRPHFTDLDYFNIV